MIKNKVLQFCLSAPVSGKFICLLRRMRMLIVLLSVGLLLSCNGSEKSFSFVQVCDPQLGMGGYEHDLGTLQQAIDQINELDVDFVIFCGDLVNHATDSSFEDFIQLRDELRIPGYVVPGNHDVGLTPTDSSLAVYREKFGDDYFDMRHKGTRFIFVNTQLWKKNIGEESTVHDEWFETALSDKKRKERLIVAGHYPLYIKQPNEEEVYANLPLDKRQQVLQLLDDSGVSAYLTGHKHEFVENNYNGVLLVSGESTSRNFDGRPFGFRKWHVSADTIYHQFVPLELNNQ